MENEKFFGPTGCRNKIAPFYTKIALKMLGQKLSFDVFVIARSILLNYMIVIEN